MVRSNGRLFGFRLTGFSLLRSSGVRCLGREVWLARPYILSEDLFRLVWRSSGSGEGCFGYGGAGSLRLLSVKAGELRWVLLPRRRPLSSSTQAGDGTWFRLVRDSAVRGSKGVVYGIWMVPLGASSLPSSSARPSSVVLCLKADAFVWSCASVLSRCFVSILRWRWFFQLRVLSPSVLEGFRWCSGSRLQ